MDQQENKSAQEDPKSTLRNNFEPRARYYTVAVSEDDTQLMHGEPASEIRTELLARRGRRKGYKAVILGESETELLVGKKERLEKIHTFKVREVDFTAEGKARREKRRHSLRRLGRIAAAVALVALGFVLGLMVPRQESAPQPVPVSTDAPTSVPTAVPTDAPTSEPTAVPTATGTPRPTTEPDTRGLEYQNGMDLMKAGEYRQAAEVFIALNNYQDSDQRVMECSAGLAVEKLRQSDLQGMIDALEIGLDTFRETIEKQVDYEVEAEGMILWCFATEYTDYDGTICEIQFIDAAADVKTVMISFDQENQVDHIGEFYPEIIGFRPVQDPFVWEDIANRLGIEP